jgi:hypothetical protein
VAALADSRAVEGACLLAGGARAPAGGESFWTRHTAEAKKQVRMVRENLRVAQSRQKSYADHRRIELSFEVGDFVYINVSPMRGLHHFKVRGKLAPRFIGPFKILEKRGEVAYQLELSP